jgi:hypothetical protein
MTMGMRLSLALVLLLCCCGRRPADQREINGVLLVYPKDDDTGVVHTWDEHGKQIATIADNQAVADQVQRLAPTMQHCVGALYDATFVIKGERHFRGTRIWGAHLVNIVTASRTTRSDEELRKLLHQLNVSVACPECSHSPETDRQVKSLGAYRCAVWPPFSNQRPARTER